MAIIYDAPVSPVDLTTFVRRVPLPNTLMLSSIFPTVLKRSSKVNFSEITKTNRTARFRAPDGRIHVADRDGYSDKSISMIPISDSRNKGEYERLQEEMARLGGTRTEALSTAIYDDGQDLTLYAQNRIEQALGDVLVDGVFAPAELSGVSIDYGVPGANLITVGTSWATSATADGLSDLIAACDLYEAANGFRPGGVLASRAAQRQLVTQTKVINAARGAQTGVTRVSLADLTGIFDNEGVPTNWFTVETQLDIDGVSTRVLPADKVILIPPNPEDLLEFQLGVSATALELVNSSEADFTFEDAPGLVGVVIKEGPPFRQFTFVDGIGLPVLKDARKLMVLDVIP
jgi:hypothetical protein